MKKFKVKTNTKGKRWAKGHSCVSNPDASKFRDAAKSRYFLPQLTKGEGKSSGLTYDALRRHDVMHTSDRVETPVEVSSAKSVSEGGLTSRTFASDWSNCSNKSFDNFLHGFQSSNALHQEMLAVLAGITEVIKTTNGSETANEYFGALMTTLEQCDNESSHGAVLALLALVIKKVSANILKMKFEEIVQSFSNLLIQYGSSDNAVIIKSLLVCLAAVFRHQEGQAWNLPIAADTFKALLAFVTHSVPKIRKVAQGAVSSILNSSENTEGMHPAANVAGEYCLSTLDSKECLSEMTRTLHVVNLLRTVLYRLPAAQVKPIVEKLLTLMTLGDAVLTKCCLQTIQGLVMARPSTKTLPSDLNTKLVNALFKFQPSRSDNDLILIWLSVMHESLSNLLRLKPMLCLEQVARFFKVCSELMCSGNNLTLIGGTALALKVVVLECLRPADTPLDNEAQNLHKAAVQGALDCMERCLKFQHKTTWKYVIHVLQAIYQVISIENEFMLNRTLNLLASIREGDDQFDLAAEIDKAFGALVKNLGPEVLLSKVPLQISGRETSFDFPSSWLIPVLRDGIEISTLSFFHTEIFPKAVACHKRWKELESQGDKNGAHIYNVLFVQLWSIFPSCCTNPTDFKYFKKIAQMLGNALNEKEISLEVMNGLRRLISVSLEDSSKLQVISNFSKNYIPILCTMYTDLSTPEGIRLASLETTKAFLKISDGEKHAVFFDKAVAKLNSNMQDALNGTLEKPKAQQMSKKQMKKNRLVSDTTQDALLQLVCALVPYQDESRLLQVVNLCSHLLLSPDHAEQKRAYRAIEQICQSEHQTCKIFLQNNIDKVVQIIVGADQICKNPSRTARCRCLLLLSEHLQPDQGQILSQMITEALLGCRNDKPKCRQIAFSLLVHLGTIRQRWTKESDSEAVLSFTQQLLECCETVYAEDPMMVSASILAISSLVHQLKEFVPVEILPVLMPKMCQFACLSIREVSKAVLSFFRCALTVFKPINMGPYISPMVSSICEMSEDCKKYLRVATKEIFVRVARKFSTAVLNDLVPEDDQVMQKRLKNIRKELERKARAKKQRQEYDEEEDDDDLDTEFSLARKPQTIESVLAECDSNDEYEQIMDESAEKKKRPKKRQKMDTWIQEGDTVLDLTDPSSMQKISAKKPAALMSSAPNSGDKNRGFKMASDGRLIIKDSDDEDEQVKPGMKRKRQKDDYSDIDDDVELDEASNVKKSLPGRYVLAGSGGDDLSRSMEDLSLMQYQPGGRGIHRPLQGVHSGVEYKASKAKGDVKKKGKVDPYAYIPLSGSLLNKRKRAKNAGKILQLEKSATKGVAKGLKARAKVKRSNTMKRSASMGRIKN